MLTTNSMQERRKLVLLLPVAVVPCLLLFFYGLGGGKGQTGATATDAVKGVNKSLPVARLDNKGKPADKMQEYEKAAADSAKLLEAQKRDPYSDSSHRLPSRVENRSGIQLAIDGRKKAVDATVDQVLARVEALKKLVSAPAGGTYGSGSARPGQTVESYPYNTVHNGQPSRPLTIFQEQGAISQRRDPEMERVDRMLDKLIKIQHPELVGRDTIGRPESGPVLTLTAEQQEAAVRGLSGAVDAPGGFMEIGDSSPSRMSAPAADVALEATIADGQTVMSGATVGLRLTRGANLGGTAVPAGQLVYGLASISGERLRIHVASLRVGVAILPVSIEVYDLDGLAGIRVPGAMTRDISKESASEAMSGLGLASMDPSLTGQAANAGLQLAKSLASRKVRAVRVALPAGYQVLLRNTKTGL